jgi:AAA family ATP:ADP antiporter
MRSSFQAFAGICALAFLILFAYALCRSPIDSLFLKAHGSGGLPWVWSIVAVVTTLVVFSYNRASAGRSLVLALGVASLISTVSYMALLLLRGADGIWYALYVWKDVQVVVLLEIVWSIANAHFETSSARRSYGIFCAFGSIGRLLGHSIAGTVSSEHGALFAMTLPVIPLAVLSVSTLAFHRARPDAGPRPEAKTRDYTGGIRVLRRSRYLSWLLLLILLTQVAITLIDLHFNQAMEAAYPDEDRRTAMFGAVYFAIDAIALGLQLTTAWILKAAGVTATLIAIPALLSISVLASLSSPQLLVVQVTRVLSKAFDYSLFRAAKEMLYIPLSYDEKTRGKSMIDMLTYRVAKGAAAALLGLLVAAGFTGQVVMSGVLVLVVVWLLVTVVVVRRYRELVSREQESSE